MERKREGGINRILKLEIFKIFEKILSLSVDHKRWN